MILLLGYRSRFSEVVSRGFGWCNDHQIDPACNTTASGFFIFMGKRKVYDFKFSDEVLNSAAMIVEESCFIMVCRKGDASYGYSVRFRRLDRGDLDFLHANFGGYLGEQATDEGLVFWLSLQQGRAFSFLKAIYPFLEKRKESADLFLEFGEIIRRNRKRRLTDEARAERVTLMARLRYLNELHESSQKNHESS